jgi:Zn-dependent peptidase ImmA (M78 family)
VDDGVRAAARAARGGAEGPLDVLALVEEEHGVPVGVLALEEGLAGAYLRRPRGALILLNGTEAAPRLRFTLAHELGHHVLSHSQSVDTAAGLRRPERPMEVQANRFAAELLAPAAAVRAWLDARDGVGVGLDEVVALGATYGISAPAALFRLVAAGALPERARVRRLLDEIEEGAHLDLRHRLGLPAFEDGLSRARERMPRVPPGSALDAFARGELGAERLAAMVRAALDDVRSTMRAVDLVP